ncbi:hypothetical protein NL676_008238 [Syzygium grande]|nr:hypothetical protein NL676_008238 [Syzygium grande]
MTPAQVFSPFPPTRATARRHYHGSSLPTRRPPLLPPQHLRCGRVRPSPGKHSAIHPPTGCAPLPPFVPSFLPLLRSIVACSAAIRPPRIARSASGRHPPFFSPRSHAPLIAPSGLTRSGAEIATIQPPLLPPER